LIGPLATPSQHLNAELINALYHFWQPIQRTIESDYADMPSVTDIITPVLSKTKNTLFTVVSPLLGAIRREFSNILARMHRLNFDKPSQTEAGSSSPYMKDLGDKLAYIRGEILGPLRVGVLSKEWCGFSELSLIHIHLIACPGLSTWQDF